MGYVSTAPAKNVGYQQLTVSSSAVGFTGANYVDTDVGQSKAANQVLLKVVSGSVRFRFDGTDPDASTGFPLSANDTLELACNPATLKFIRTAAPDAVIEALFLKG